VPPEAARALVARAGHGMLATVDADGAPWASLVAHAALPDGAPVLLVSTFAEHGRNLAADPRASLCVTEPAAGEDALDRGRVTLAGAVERPEDGAALAAFLAAHPSAEAYAGFEDFTCWVLRPQRIRWVGGFARMDTVDPAAYRDVRS
jgi:heme iron utilization protein